MPKVEVTVDRLPVACFAPSLTDESIASYRSAVDALETGPIKDACNECLAAIEAWWKLPESSRTDADKFKIIHNGKDATFAVTPLEDDHVKALWDLVPWSYELDAMQSLFYGIPVEQKSLRDMAFHLHWHARELCNDREPLTQDKLQ